MYLANPSKRFVEGCPAVSARPPMIADTMIERVARAIAGSRDGDAWRDYVPAARAAVLAMREPTVEMLEAATPGLVDFGYLPEEWQAMIDHVGRERPN